MYFDPLYCKLNDGREMVVWSDNEDDETMTVFPVADLIGYDAEFQSYLTVPYSAVIRTDRNRTVAFI
jgi:hypothetical protein